MKFRRAMVTAAATAVIAPVALLSTPAAFASDGQNAPTSAGASAGESSAADQSSGRSGSNTGTDTGGDTKNDSGSDTDQSGTGNGSDTDQSGSGNGSDTGQDGSDTASDSASTSASASTEPSTTPSSSSPRPSDSAEPAGEPSDEPTDLPGICQEDAGYTSKLHTRLNGLPGKIAAGSGWHAFTLSVENPTKTSAKDVMFYAGVGPNDPDAAYAFKASQVQLQVKTDGVWTDITDGEGHSEGFLDLADIGGGKTVTYQLRMNVKASAPIGEGLTIGGGVYFDEDANCVSADDTSYVIQIVAPGSDTGGAAPQEGGKVPLPTEKPNQDNTRNVTGTLAETGSSSMLPTIGLVGGVAVVVGAGALFTVRRRRSGADA
jgi:LPXTG-motif cell wall-anchored protein